MSSGGDGAHAVVFENRQPPRAVTFKDRGQPAVGRSKPGILRCDETDLVPAVENGVGHQAAHSTAEHRFGFAVAGNEMIVGKAIDEIDKIGSDFRGDPSSALLEVLDPEQNGQFSDHYIETPFDLSRVLFIATANTLSTIPPALLDRMEVIELSGYTEAEKLEIARRYLVPRQLEAHGLAAGQIQLEDSALEKVVSEYTREAGVRNLERFVATLMRKCARRIALGTDEDKTPIQVNGEFVSEALGAPPHLPEAAERSSMPGVAVGLAVTPHGGDILFIEATSMKGGKGLRLRLTGQIGDVMKESAEAALSWVRAHAADLGLPPEALEPGEIHLHIPAGAVPKDGPSAGIALVTSIVSALSGRRARSMLAMTGEISLRGRVLPVGGIKGKLFAASRAGIETVVLPKRNAKDLVEVPEDVKQSLDIRLVDRLEEALDLTMGEKPLAATTRPQS